MNPNTGISIIIPLHNEERNVAYVANELRQVMSTFPYPWELVLVDDGSTDQTFAEIMELLNQWPEPKLKAIRLDQRCGQSQALWEGLSQATQGCLLTLDGDRQYVADDIQRFLMACRNADVVSGVRAFRCDQWGKRWFSHAANALRRLITGSELADSGCAFRMFSREQLKHCQPMHGFHRFILTMFENAELQIVTIPVQHYQRLAGQSKYSNLARVFVPLVDLLAIQWLHRRRFQSVSKETYQSSSLKSSLDAEASNYPWPSDLDTPVHCDYSYRPSHLENELVSSRDEA